MKILSWLHDLTANEENESQIEHPISPALVARLSELDRMSVREVMVPRAVITALDVDVQVRRVRRLRSSKLSYFPVYKGDLDHILGWVSKQKVLELLSEPAEDVQVSQYVRPVGEIQEDATVADLADAFLKSASPFVIVKNAQGATVGLVPLSEFVELVFGFELGAPPQPVPAEPSAPLLRSYEI